MSICPEDTLWIDDCKSVKEPYDEELSEDSKTLDIKSINDASEEDETLLVICDEN